MKQELDYISIGRRIRRLRKQKDWTQEKLSEMADLTEPHVSHIETGATKLSLPALYRIAAALDTTADKLLYEDPASSYAENYADFCGAISTLCSQCSSQELNMILSLIKTVLCHFPNLRGNPKK